MPVARRLVVGGVVCALLVAGGAAWAHWCSNIFAAAARMVVKPEKTTVNISGGSAQLKVYLQNNFPYKLFDVEMRGQASGYTIQVSPAQQDVSPGQNVTFTYDISGPGGNVDVSNMNLQVRIRSGQYTWDTSDWHVDQSPAQSKLIQGAVYDSSTGEQAASLNAAIIADKYPSATLGSGAPFFGRTGMEQLIHWFGYRFCYSSGGSWRCQPPSTSSEQDCPSPCAEGNAWTSTEQFPQHCMRAGVEVGVRRAKLGSNLQKAQAAAINALKGGSAQHRCLAAVVGGWLWSNETSTTSFETALQSVSSICEAAGLRALGKGSSSSCGSGQFYEKAACAAAEGLRGNDAPVKNVLMQNAGDGENKGGYTGLYYAYMLYLVTGARYDEGKTPTYYPGVGPAPQPDIGPPPMPDFGGPPPDGWTPPDWMPPPGNEAGVSAPDSGGTGNNATGNILEGGCGCRLAARPRGAPAALALLLLSALLLARRRNR